MTLCLSLATTKKNIGKSQSETGGKKTPHNGGASKLNVLINS
jgi:hypothetical protein